MKLSDFDFSLPADRIALRPARPRDAARLLVVSAKGDLADRTIADLPGLLRSGDVLVFNNTRVIPARLFGVRSRDGQDVKVQATLLKRRSAERWTALMKPGKRLKVGDQVVFAAVRQPGAVLNAVVVAKDEDGAVDLSFELAGAELDRAIGDCGAMPLPPYISAQRSEDDQDREDYQTVFAQETGSVAAPTAGLHMTPELLKALTASGIATVFVTLHVGAGTFLPVKVDDVADHRMHAESGEISGTAAETLNAARKSGGAHHLRGHDLAKASRKRGRARRRPALQRRDGDFHHAGVSLQGCGCSLDQLPLTQVHASDVGVGVRGHGDHAARLRSRPANRISLLFLWRREPLV